MKLDVLGGTPFRVTCPTYFLEFRRVATLDQPWLLDYVHKVFATLGQLDASVIRIYKRVHMREQRLRFIQLNNSIHLEIYRFSMQHVLRHFQLAMLWRFRRLLEGMPKR